jgi:hypothetical protein
MESNNNTKEIKRLLKLHLIAESKIEYSYNNLGIGKVVNKMQQAAATRIYRMAKKVDIDMSGVDFVKLHKEANEEMKIENPKIYDKWYNNGIF